MPQRSSDEIFSIPVVAYTTEERYEFGIVLVAAHADFTFVFNVFAGTDIIGMQTVVGEIGIINRKALVLRVLVAVAHHGLEVVLAQTGAEIGYPFEDILALLLIAAAGLAVAALVDGAGAGRGAEPGIVVVVLVVGEHHLGIEGIWTVIALPE